ncbi:restriction endonuclease subunit S [Apilactobacillus sp. TMW 2.2459]|uniref:restriction endonuclease subunit S n=1 Tax=Apilactobacillus xinyiensis TaxID=2841032 RepID=UPI00200C027F|nr:restriction endonuclease subunit S [Apilactobacillus xinyiensis]MCL0311544.1 restriction endonuclease subunit S [Apilactobacillus xinyiensis]MCL0330078.1 restriction endonuclease subunit S [Apilactobacillus xinyiensis]
MTTSKNSKLPRLRFKEFIGEWEEKKLGDVSFSKNSSLTSKSVTKNGNYDLYDANGIIGKTNIFYSKNIYISIIKDGSGVGTLRMMPKFSSITGTMNYIDTNNSNIFFIYYLMGLLNISKYKIGTGIPHIYYKDYSKTNVLVPNISEQDKIGDFFTKLDRLIELQTKRVEQLKRLKRGYLQKMFPQKGETVPRLRFTGFSGEWEEKKLGDLGNVIAGGDVKKNKLLNVGRYPVIANNMKNNGIVGYYNDEFKIYNSSVTITGRGNIGFAKARFYKFTPIVRLLVLQSEILNATFAEKAINNINIYNESTGVPQLTAPQLKTYKIKYTSMNEQDKISKFCSNLDKKIELQEKKLSQLQDMKKGYLQKMFC